MEKSINIMKRFPRFAPLFALLIVFGTPNLFCPLITDYTVSEQATINAPMCAPFKIVSVSGLPNGPAKITWTKTMHGQPGSGYAYFYEVTVVSVGKNAAQTSTYLADVFVVDPVTTVTVPLKANSPSTIASYTIMITEGYAYHDYPDHVDDPRNTWRLDCQTTYEYKLPTPQARILPSKTPVPTMKPPTAKPAAPPTNIPNTPVPPTNIPNTPVPPTRIPNTPVPPTSIPNTPVPPTRIPNTPVPPTSVPPTSVPTPCLPGQTGDPVNGIPCIKIPG